MVSLRLRLALLVGGLVLALVVGLLGGFVLFHDLLPLAIALVVAGAVGAYLIAVSLMRPVLAVTRVASRIADGDDTTTAVVGLNLSRTDEVGQLASAFHRMLLKLYASEQSVRALNLQLERGVEQRTIALAQSNRELETRLKELRSAQEQLVAADRRVSIGTLSAGVAHEINNPLGFIAGNLHYLGDELEALGNSRDGASANLDEMKLSIKDAIEGCERVRVIVNGLRAFSRGDESQRVPVKLETAMNDALLMVRSEMKHRARLVLDYQTAPEVMANQVRLSQVFLNLLVNAAHSIEQGSHDANEIRVRVFTDADGFAVAEVSDTGKGIEPDAMGRLFDPFYTTKPVGSGTGLGLLICQGIVASLGGTITVSSEVGRGSTFRVNMPPARPAPEELPALNGTGASAEGHGNAAVARKLRVLLVDDEPMLASVIARMMRKYATVVSFQDAREALRSLGTDAGYDAVLCDLMMPNMNGVDFYEALCHQHGQLRESVLFVSGGAFEPSLRQFADDHAERFLAKPVDPAQLKNLLYRVVGIKPTGLETPW